MIQTSFSIPVALTNGVDIDLDANKRPNLLESGLFTQNKNGLWKVMCSYETDFHIHGAKTAKDICTILGFSGSSFHNTTSFVNTNVHIDPSLATKENVFRMHVDDPRNHFDRENNKKPDLMLKRSMHPLIEHVIPVEKDCTALYVECIPKSNNNQTIKILKAGQEIIELKTLNIDQLKPIISPKAKPQVAVKPSISKQKEDVVNKVVEKIQNLTLLVNNKLHQADEYLHWPWLADIYVNGKLHCIGILVDKNWVLVHQSCYDDVK